MAFKCNVYQCLIRHISPLKIVPVHSSIITDNNCLLAGTEGERWSERDRGGGGGERDGVRETGGG